MRLLAVIALGAVLTACGSATRPGGPGGPPPTLASTSASPGTMKEPAGSASGTHPASAKSTQVKKRTPTSAKGWARLACDDFQTFYIDLTTDTPHAINVLVPDAERVLRAAVQAADLDTTDKRRKLFNDANDLMAYVGSANFASQGNFLGVPIQHMQDDCP